MLVDHSLAPDVSVSHLATQTAALIASDITDLAAHTKFMSYKCALGAACSFLPTIITQDSMEICLSAADFTSGLAKVRSSYSEIIGAPRIPNISWDDVGGLEDVKYDILDTIQVPLNHPELFAEGLKKRSGVQCVFCFVLNIIH